MLDIVSNSDNKFSKIHPTSIVDSTAKISYGVEIGAYSIIGENVEIGENSIIHSHVVIENSFIGKNCEIFSGAIIGSDSQDLKSDKNLSFVILGDNNIIREYVTINRASIKDKSTIIGNKNLFMAYVHIAHDCIIGDNNILANSVNLGGYVLIDNHTIIGGLTGIHQFVRVGSYSIIGGLSRINHDVPPYFMVVGNPAIVEGVNIKGLRRNNFTRVSINSLRNAYKTIYHSKLQLTDALNLLENDYINENDFEHLKFLVDFMKMKSKRGIIGLNFKSISK